MDELDVLKSFTVKRFAVFGALACGAALVSCGNGSGVWVVPTGDVSQRVVVPVSRNGTPDLEMTAYYFTAPDDFGFVKGQEKPGVAGTYPKEVGERVVRSLSRCRKFKRFTNTGMVATTGFGETGQQKIEREFIYPTEYEPPVVKVMDDGVGKLVTPATPTAFDMKQLGVSLEYSGTRVADGRIRFRLKLDRSAFLGFVNYGAPIMGTGKGLFGRDVKVILSENRIEIPVFDQKAVSAEIYVNDGDFIAISGFMPNDPPKTKEFVAWTVAEVAAPESCRKNFVALIQVRSAK